MNAIVEYCPVCLRSLSRLRYGSSERPPTIVREESTSTRLVSQYVWLCRDCGSIRYYENLVDPSPHYSRVK